MIGFLFPENECHHGMEAERCRSLTVADETITETDGGANHKKPPRKARKKLLVAQDSILSHRSGWASARF